MRFTKAEARAIKALVHRAIEADRECIFSAGDGVRPTQALVMAQAKVISAAAMKLGDEWEA